MLRGFMLLKSPQERGMRVAALPSQILPGVVEFILIKSKSRLGKVQLVSGVRSLLLGQLCDAVLISRNLRL